MKLIYGLSLVLALFITANLFAVPAQVAKPIWNVETDVVSWTAVSGALDYSIQLYKNGTAMGSEVTGIVATTYDLHATLLADGTPASNNNKYSVKARARDASGYGTYSELSLNNVKGLSGITIQGIVEDKSDVSNIIWTSSTSFTPFVYSAGTIAYAHKIRHEVRGIHIYLPNRAAANSNNPVAISGAFYGTATITLLNSTPVSDSVYLDLEMARSALGLNQATTDQNNIITLVVNPGNAGFEKTYTLNLRRRMGCSAASIGVLMPQSTSPTLYSINTNTQFSSTITGNNTAFSGGTGTPSQINGDTFPTFNTLLWQVLPGTGTAYFDDNAILQPLSNGTFKVSATTIDGTNINRISAYDYNITGQSGWYPHIGKIVLRNANNTSDNINYSPKFNSSQASGTIYRAFVANGVTSIILSTMAPADMQLYVNNTRVANNAEVVLNLFKGINTYPITVSNGTSQRTYTVVIERESAVRLQFGDTVAANAPFLSAPDGTQFGLDTAADKTKMTIEAWVKWTTTPVASGIYQWANIVTMDRANSSDVGQFWLQHDVSNQHFEFAVRTDTGRNFVQSRTVPVKDVWYHLAGVLSGGKIRLFVNGIEEANASRTGNINPILSNDRLYIGKSPNSAGMRIFQGNIRQVRLWMGSNRGPGQVLEDFSGINPVNPAPNYAWNLDETAPAASVASTLGDVTLAMNNVQVADFTGGSTVNETVVQTFVFRPTRIDLSTATSESVVLVSARNYANTGRLRLDSANLIWNPVTKTWVTAATNANGIDFIGSPITGTRFWVPIQRATNTTVNANYIDALATNYGANNVVLPLNASTAMGTAFSISGNLIGTTQYPTTVKYVALGYDQVQYGTLITGSSTSITASKDGKGIATYNLASDVPIKRIEIRTLDDILVTSMTSVTGWSAGTVLGDQTLPLELSSFTAVVTPQRFVRLDWVTHSETGVSGYYIYRSNANYLAGAEVISPLISASNTSHEESYSFTDTEVSTGFWYYWLQNIDMDGQQEFFGPLRADVQTDTPDTPIIPLETNLGKPYPNPFNPEVTIAYGLAKTEHLQILIYNNKGQKLRTLVDATVNPGSVRLLWNGTDDNGRALSSGMYFIKMTAGKYTATQKVILLK